MAPKPEVPPPVHEDWNEPVEQVTSWAEDAAPAPAAPAAFGAAPPAQEDWAAQVHDTSFWHSKQQGLEFNLIYICSEITA